LTQPLAKRQFRQTFSLGDALPQNITVGHKQLMAEAEAQVSHVTAAEAIELAKRGDIVVVDIRDPRELQREGKIPGSFHAPRGMLEFWVDPESPYHKPIFAEDKTFVIHCASGWRSLLATQILQRMGLNPVVNMKGGFGAWKEAGGPVEKVEPK
jgi:rhodanese-related sulfurtransferase